MAYDKLCDSAVLDAGLLQIANAIREKAGIGDSLAFPAGMAEAIAAISAGGGVINGASYVCGSFTMESDYSTEFAITHEPLPSGQVSDDVYLIWPSASTLIAQDGSWGTNTFIYGVQAPYKHPTAGTESSSGVVYKTNSSGNPAGSSVIFINNYNRSEFKIKASSSYMLKAGKTYYWLRIASIL